MLSPVLFNIIMDRLLQSLNKKPTSLTISNLSIGCAAHADDIRACCVGLDTVKELAVNIDNFAISNSLKQNMSKTEIVHLSCHSLPQDTVDLYSQEVEIKHNAKCLGGLVEQGPLKQMVYRRKRQKSKEGVLCSWSCQCVSRIMQSLDLPQHVHNFCRTHFTIWL